MYLPHAPWAFLVFLILGAVAGQIPIAVAIVLSLGSVSLGVVSFLLRSLLHARFWG